MTKYESELFAILRKMLTNGAPAERKRALRIMRLFGSDCPVTPEIVECLKDVTGQYRELAIKLLASIGKEARSQTPKLIEILQGRWKGKDWARKDAALALGEIGDAAAIEVLRSVIVEGNEQDPVSEAITAIGKFGSTAQNTVPLLLDCLNDIKYQDYWCLILETISKLQPKSQDVLPVLRKQLRKRKPNYLKAMIRELIQSLTAR